MSDLAAQLDTSDRHRGQTAPGGRGHAVGNSTTAVKVGSRPILLLIASGIALIAAIAIGTAITIVNLRDSALANSERELGNTALLLAKYADQEIRELELVQNSLIEKIQALGNVSSEDFERKMSGKDVHSMLKDKISGLSHISSLALINSDGMLINDSDQWPIPPIDVADRNYFKTLKSDAKLTSFVSEPMRGRRTGKWTIFFARKITTPNGEFLGAILGMIEPLFFEKYFESVILGEGSSLSLYRNDGTLLVRHPRIEPVIGRVFKGAVDALGERQRATTRLVGKMDGKDRLLAAQRLEHFPLFISVGVDVAVALANWQKEVIVLIGLGSLAALMIAVMVFVIVRQLLQGKKQFQQQFDNQNLQLNTALNNTSQGLIMFDSAARLVVCNDRYRQICKLTPDLTQPGCTFLDILNYRFANGTFSGNPEEYVSSFMAAIAKGKAESREIKTADGRIISVVNQPMAGGGWVATHEDITEAKRQEASFRLLFKNNPVPMWVYDLDSLRFLAVNEAAIAHYGYSHQQFLAMTVMDIRPPEERERFAKFVQQAGGTHQGEQIWRHQKSDKTKIDVAIYSRALSYDGHKAALVASIDVTERKKAEALIEESHNNLERAEKMARLGHYKFEIGATAVTWSDGLYRIVGKSPESFTPTFSSVSALVHPDDRPALAQYRHDVLSGRELASLPLRLIKDDGQIVYLENWARPIRASDGSVTGMFGTLQDITERKRAEDELRRTKHFLDTVIENVPQPIVVKSVPGMIEETSECRFTLINRAAEELFGISRDQMIGKNAHDIYAKDHADFVVNRDIEALRASGPIQIREHTVEKSNHDIRIVTSRKVAIRDDNGKPEHLLSLLEDVTERKRSEQRIAHMAHHDMLTDLPNRAAFNERLSSVLDRAAKAHEQFAVMSIDFDSFKEINDLFGHATGDALLLEVARRMQTAAGDTFLARIGGDEFSLIVADGQQPATASALSDRLLAAVADKFEVEGLQLSMGLSIGVAVYPTDGADTKTLMSNADAALYRAKAEARGSVRFFEAEMDTRQRERLALQNDLRLAIDRGELALHYQPQLKTAGEPVGFEALVRWRCPKRGMVAPGTFIPIAEESSLIISIGEWVLREACREAASWPQPLSIAVNVSPIQFHNGDLPSLVHAILLETGLAPARLELEVTEGVLINDFSRALSILRRLKSLGVQIALDDFGTGYSSLSYLHSFAFDKIKIDRAFIGDLEHNRHSMAIVRAVISLGRSLELPVLAEGVETEAQHAILVEEGCDEVQGYLTGRPLPIADYAELIGRQATARQKLHSIVAA